MKNLILTLPTKVSTQKTLLSLLKELNISFELTEKEPIKDEILENIKNGLQEVRLFKKGKLKTTPAKDFLNEL